MEEINLFLASDNSLPPGIENDDYNSEGDIHFLEELLSNDPLPEIESSNLDHFNDLSSPRPPPKPPDVEICFDVEPDTIVKNDFDELNEDECFNPWGFLLYFSPPGVKTPFLTLASLLRAGGISSGWNFHPGHLAARLGCAETKFATWDDLAFKLIILGGNGYLRKGQKSKPKRQNRARERKDREKSKKTKSKSTKKSKSKSTPGSGIGKSIKNQTRRRKLSKVGPPVPT
ncbi:hypothetical protein Tco_0261930 [Tanacetum coccineum]